MFGKKKKEDAPEAITRDRIDAYREERRGLEVDLLDEVLRSRQRAWVTAIGSWVFGLVCLFVVVFVVYRYAQPIAEHILTLNKDTGVVQEVSLMKKQDSYGERIDAYWVSQFVIHRESYDFYAAQADYDAIGLMATSEVADAYQSQFQGPHGKDKRLGDSLTTRVHITSVIVDTEHHIATVRYTTIDKHRSRPLPEPTKYWIATVAYEYVSVPETATQRYINPLGFRVTSFRTNPESVGQVGG